MAMSDMHGLLPDLREQPVDLVLMAGDIAPDYTEHNKDVAIEWYTHEFYRWCKSFVRADKIFFILGSHDYALETYYPLLYETFGTHSNKVQFMHNETRIYRKGDRELSIYGTEYNVANRQYAFSKTDKELLKVYMKNNDFVDIVMSHEAPYGFGDTNSQEKDERYRNMHMGSVSLKKYVQRMEPEILVHGKYHSGSHYRGRIGNTEVYNVCLMDENNQLTYKPFMFEI